VVALAATATTLAAIEYGIDHGHLAATQGKTLSLEQLGQLADRLCASTTEERLRLPGLHPKRADLIPVGALLLLSVVKQLRAPRCVVSDRGLRWGVLRERFGS
jgi:exopolyphosphatase/guanosine-5'-triphosphate,3'-diphosphate pyrophosphatase